MRIFNSIFGFCLFLLLVLGYCQVTAVPVKFLHFWPLLFLATGILGTAFLAFGAKETGTALNSFRYFFYNPKAGVDTGKTIIVLNFMILSCFAQGGILFVIEILSFLKHLGPLMSTPKEDIGTLAQLLQVIPKLAHPMICTLFAALFISEALLRPLKARLETLDWK
jgi:hypothetical protein